MSGPRYVATRLSECLPLGGRYYTMASELNLDDLPIGEQVPAGARVLLCTVNISTENTVRRAGAAIAGGSADPLAIACTVDARQDRQPIRLLNRTIPVIGLTEADVTLKLARRALQRARRQHRSDTAAAACAIFEQP